MTPSNLRKIDALVAEHVMQTLKPAVPGTEYVFGRWTEGDANIPHYSSRIEDAWQVVEKLSDHKFQVQRSNSGFDCYFFDGRLIQLAEAETAPLAICLAALKLKGINY